MLLPHIPWHPRVVLTGRVFRLPVQAARDTIEFDPGGFILVDSRWDVRDAAWYFYLRAPGTPGDYAVTAHGGGRAATAVIRARTLDELRRPHVYNGATWPRRWPPGQAWTSTKRRQTLQDMPRTTRDDRAALDWWASQPDDVLWRQLPYPEFPQAHFVNVHQGCPNCGTAVFKFGGFYPWKRSHRPCDFKSTCPSCDAVYPTNDLTADDYTSGDAADDGFGYFDEKGHIYLFAATYHRDQVVAFDAGLRTLTARLRQDGFDDGIARRAGVMLLRYAVDILYVAAVPQYRYGPSMGEETPWKWGQPDWASEPDPVGALSAKGMRRYCIDIPYVSESLALAYDTVWPLLREDREMVSRAQALGLPVETPEEVTTLIEEMLAAQLQCILDRGGRSNLPRESMGALTLLRALDRPDAQDAMDWLYDEGPDRLRVFGINDFFPDGAPPEATGGYNGIHTNGLFALEYHLRALRQLHPEAYPDTRYPSLMGDPRAARVARHPCEITMIGKSWFQYGDGSAPGSKAQLGLPAGDDALTLEQDVFHEPLDPATLERAAAYTGDPVVQAIHDAVRNRRHRRLGTTIHDGVGIAILRTGETPERAALGVVYGDATSHRHMDLLDVQLFAFRRPFLTDLGYPQSWATIAAWEGHWATHNTVWSVVPDTPANRIAGRGRLVRTLFADGLQILDLEAERWVWNEQRHRWFRPGVTFRRLLALVETDGDGVAVADLSRIRGGTEHWRVCRGLQGVFETDDLAPTPQPGTVANPDRMRGDTSSLPHPDYAGLAWMDDVAAAAAPDAWTGVWRSSKEPTVYLDLHQLRVSAGATILTARATAVMGTPEESGYAFRTLLWRRTPQNETDVTCVDLVMEPRTGEATLTDVRTRRVTRGDAAAAGVAITTKGGKRIDIYWAPESGPETPTAFDDGTTLYGPLAAVTGQEAVATGSTGLARKRRVWRFAVPQSGRIAALDRNARTVDVEGCSGIKPGDRIRINPDGRGHNYRVEDVQNLEDGALRLTLDTTSLLGRANVVSVGGDTIELGMHIIARTGNLDQTRLVVEETGAWAVIAEAANPEPGRTTVRVDDAGRLRTLQPGAWVSVVDYVAGDTIQT